jgi:hypothetical protein
MRASDFRFRAYARAISRFETVIRLTVAIRPFRSLTVNESNRDVTPIDPLFRLHCRFLEQEHIVAFGIV